MSVRYEWESGAVAAGAIITSNIVKGSSLNELSVLVDNSDATCVTDRDLTVSSIAYDGATVLFSTAVTVKQKTRKLVLIGSQNAPPANALPLSGTAGVRASATGTCATVIATDKITINGHDFVAIANGEIPAGDEFAVGAGDTADADTATALAAAINASETAGVAGYVTATAAGAVVTITATASGVLGNRTTLTSTGGTITVTGAGYLAGGAAGTEVEVSYVPVPISPRMKFSLAAGGARPAQVAVYGR
jgi:hypothetical protein